MMHLLTKWVHWRLSVTSVVHGGCFWVHPRTAVSPFLVEGGCLTTGEGRGGGEVRGDLVGGGVRSVEERLPVKRVAIALAERVHSVERGGRRRRRESERERGKYTNPK